MFIFTITGVQFLQSTHNRFLTITAGYNESQQTFPEVSISLVSPEAL